jgi:hypothetical protein
MFAVVHGDTIENNTSCGIVSEWSNISVLECVISGSSYGIVAGPYLFRAGTPLEQCMTLGGKINSTQHDSLIIERCTLTGNQTGLIGMPDHDVGVRISWSNIAGNGWGVDNYYIGFNIDARLNCWGHPTGPGGVGPGLGDRVSNYVDYYPWLANGTPIASSSRLDPTARNNARKIVRDECPPYYKVVYTDGMGVWIIMTSDPVAGPWTDPIEVWPVDLIHHSTEPAIAIEKNDPIGSVNPYSRLHLVWSEHLPDQVAPGEIYYSYSEDGGFQWSSPLNLSNTPATASDYPSVAVDGTDVVHVVWQEHAAMAPDILYTNNSVDGWTTPTVISPSSLADMYPTIASNYQYYYGSMPPLAPDDRVHIAWTQFGPSPSGGNSPWIAYRSYDPMWGWLPELDSLPEDATVGMGGAFASIIAYPSLYEVGRAPAVAWHWPYHDEEPPVSPSGIWFNERTPGIWGTPRPVWEWIPDFYPSRYASLSPQVGPFGDVLWVMWEEWDTPEPGRCEIYSAYSRDFGDTWEFYLNLSQTRWDLSVYPGLAYQKGVSFDGLYDLCWTEIELFQPLQVASHVYYIGATSLRDSVYAGTGGPVVTDPACAEVICFPNPAASRARFTVSVAGPARIDISIYDIRGRLVRCLEHHATGAGTQLVDWDCRDSRGAMAASGVYFYELTAAGRKINGRVVLLR